MKLSGRDQYYGVLLRQLVKYDALAVSEVGDKAGHFCINDGTYLLVKYASNEQSPWRFTFRPEDISVLVADQGRAGLFGGSHVCLICGFDSICTLQVDEWSELLDLGCLNVQQTIRVRRSVGCQMEVIGSKGKLDKKIPATRFPSIIFEEGPGD